MSKYKLFFTEELILSFDRLDNDIQNIAQSYGGIRYYRIELETEQFPIQIGSIFLPSSADIEKIEKSLNENGFGG